jgi:preprotein translocase subunit SecY
MAHRRHCRAVLRPDGVVTLTGGTMLLMWMGEQITARGIGNGVSLIIFAGIVAELPKAIVNLISQARATSVNVVFVIAIAAMVIALVVFIVFMERSQRRLLIQYPKRQQAHGFAQGQKSFLPLKINTAGVIPADLCVGPADAAAHRGGLHGRQRGRCGGGHGRERGSVLACGELLGRHLDHIISYCVLVIFFTFFYTSIMFNPEETADNLRKYGGFIPGIRPGSNTAAYFDYVLTRLTVIGALYLTFVCVLPELLRRYYPEIPFYIGGRRC